MLKRILIGFASLLVVAGVCLSTVFISAARPAKALEEGLQQEEFSSAEGKDYSPNINDDSLNRNKDLTQKNEVNSEDYPDFGSDQVFPFVAGLDSY